MFAISSKFYQFCVGVYRLICLNALFLLFSLPIVTVGAAFSALVETLLTTDDINIWRPFFQAFKAHFLRSFPVMGFTLASILFIQNLQVTNLGGSTFLLVVKLVFVSFVISYNINAYLMLTLFGKQKMMALFRLSFIFTIGTFFKTCFFPLLVIGLAYLSLSVIGYGTFFFVISWPVMLYFRFIRKDICNIEKNEELVGQALVESREGVL